MLGKLNNFSATFRFRHSPVTVCLWRRSEADKGIFWAMSSELVAMLGWKCFGCYVLPSTMGADRWGIAAQWS